MDIHTEVTDGIMNDRRKEMRKYYINWFRYMGLYILANAFQIHFGFKINFLISFFMYVAFIMLSTDRKGEE